MNSNHLMLFVGWSVTTAALAFEVKRTDSGLPLQAGVKHQVATLTAQATAAVTVQSSHPECQFTLQPAQEPASTSQRALTLVYQKSSRRLSSCQARLDSKELSRILFFNLKTEPGQNFAEVRFTDPPCSSKKIKGYYSADYDKADYVVAENGVPTLDGGFVTATKRGSYCLHAEKDAARNKPGSPYRKLAAWIGASGPGSRIIVSSFTFSDRKIQDDLCKAVKRGAELEFSTGTQNNLVKRLRECGGTYFPGNKPDGSSGRLHHSKFFLILPESGNAQLVFQSANISSGVTLHHENWNFVSVQKQDPIIAEHICYHQAIKDNHYNRVSVNAFKEQLETCRAKIQGPSELAIETFFVPARKAREEEGHRLNRLLVETLGKSDSISIAAHHFLQTRSSRSAKPTNEIFTAIKERLRTDPDFKARILLDAELFWIGQGQRALAETGKYPHDHYGATVRKRNGCEGRRARFSWLEWTRLQELFELGLEVRWVETNFISDLLFHNKILIFGLKDGTQRVLTGAGNFSKAAFYKNGENFYFISDSTLTDSFKFYYGYLWDYLATAPEKMPVTWAMQVDGLSNWRSWSKAIEAEKFRNSCR